MRISFLLSSSLNDYETAWKENNFKIIFFFNSNTSHIFFLSLSLSCIRELHLRSVIVTEFHSLHNSDFSYDVKALCEHLPFVFFSDIIWFVLKRRPWYVSCHMEFLITWCSIMALYTFRNFTHSAHFASLHWETVLFTVLIGFINIV